MWHSVWQRRSKWQRGWEGPPDAVPRTTDCQTDSPVGSLPTAS
jgi:hypothetical protein